MTDETDQEDMGGQGGPKICNDWKYKWHWVQVVAYKTIEYKFQQYNNIIINPPSPSDGD